MNIQENIEFKKLVRDAMSILLQEIREFDTVIKKNGGDEDVSHLVGNSKERMHELVKMHCDSWPQELKDQLLIEFIFADCSASMSRLALEITMIHHMTGKPMVEIAEFAWKKAQQMVNT